MSIQQVGIIGYGWLGSALTSHLVKLGLNVVATSQSKEKFPIIEHAGADAEVLSLPCDKLVKASKLPTCDALVILITPQFKKGKKDYADKVASLLANCDPLKVKTIILISSTAVYGQQQGLLNENTPIDVDNEKVKLISDAEHHVCNYSPTSRVLRVGGLVGPNRHPGRFFKQDHVLKTSKTLVNLVHLDDVVSAIFKVLNTEAKKQIYNVCSTTHVTKEEFYQKARRALKLTPLKVDNTSEKTVKRIICSELIRNELSLSFKFDDLLSWLEQ